jgi:hypothetical protein
VNRARGGWWRGALAALAVVVGLADIACAESPIGWTPGEGAFLPGHLWVAADLNFGVEIPEKGPDVVEIDHLSLLARWEPTPRLAVFGELRLDEPFHVIEREGASTSDAELSVERLYAEVLLTQTLTLRIGKVFTPFGLWNPVHRAPLLWTVEEPAIADGLFPTGTTGLSLLHRTTWEGWSFDSTLYGPVQDELTTRHAAERGWIVGGRVAAGRALGQTFGTLGLDAVAYRPRHSGDWTTATGLDFEWSVGGHQVTSEASAFVPSGRGRTAHGAYVQDAVPLAPLGPFARDLYGTVRAEYFQPSVGPAGAGGLVGFFWRPRPYLILRADYLFANRTLEELQPGFHASISLLF